ncbi:hypothetical protein [Mycolicibacterium helvum]|uniref:Uncharacterized protein n=1 Tax=Mycolicibacterium helvum TaxID=1534349 RepID=A0A7I7TEV9_9MYCO|nr:hypothetical protein [Mycolicibacterium helvum]BBY67762.1 hypothetical protein MHEL_60050 [Mycolicibacterium helvum]
MTATISCTYATDPGTLTPAQWSGRLAALRSRGATDTDMRVAECLAALAYWRVRRVLDADREHLNPAHVPALTELLEHAHPAVSR